MKYLYNIGCSFSEGNGLSEDEGLTEGKQPSVEGIEFEKTFRYSALLAKKLHLQEINEATGGGSNQRIFRKVWDWISTNTDKLSETLFIIQWTFPIRAEYFRKIQRGDNTGYPKRKWYHVRWAYQLWENFDAPDRTSSSNQTIRMILSLQSFFKENGIKFIFFEGDDTHNEGSINYTSDLGKLIDLNYWILESFVGYSGKELTLNGHPNKKMQIEWTNKLEKLIKDKNWLS